MKKITCLLLLASFLYACTSNTIFKEPKDLIPKDTMSLLIQEMIIASSAKFMKTKNNQKNINYMPFVYDQFKIDSARFDRSNYYYMSKIDDYHKILEDAKNSLEKRSTVFKNLKRQLDSIKKDSLELVKINKRKADSLKIVKDLKKDSIKKPQK